MQSNAAKPLELTNQEISRQLDIVPPSILGAEIAIIGCGAIGSWTAISLAKMGFKNMTLIDDDLVDIVNMSSQFFAHEDVGQSKAEMLSLNIFSFTNFAPAFIAERWTPTNIKLDGFDIVIVAVDSMEVRSQVYAVLKDKAINCKAIIDPRMGAETALMYTINPMQGKDQEMYEKTLYSDADAIQAPCTAKSTTYCALVLSGLVAKAVRDVLFQKPYMRTMQMSLKGNAFECQSSS